MGLTVELHATRTMEVISAAPPKANLELNRIEAKMTMSGVQHSP